MTDLDTRLRSVDRLPEPDLWDRAQQRARTLPAGGEDLPEQGPLAGQRVAAAIVAFVVFGGAVALMAGAFDREGLTAADDATTPSPATWDPTAYERTRDLEGMELLRALGAVRLGFVPGVDVGSYQEGSPLEVDGEPVPGCPPIGAPGYVLIGMGDGTFYCVGVRDGEEGFDIGRRASPTLTGEPPQLLGRELALALGLRELELPAVEGEPVDMQGCEVGASEVRGGGLFCLDGLIEPDDPDKDFKFAMYHDLLSGHEVTPQVIADIRVVLDMGDGAFDATLACPGGAAPGGAGWDFGSDPEGITDDPVGWVRDNASGLDPFLDLGMSQVPGGVVVVVLDETNPLAYVEFGTDEAERSFPRRATVCPESGIEDFNGA